MVSISVHFYGFNNKDLSMQLFTPHGSSFWTILGVHWKRLNKAPARLALCQVSLKMFNIYIISWNISFNYTKLLLTTSPSCPTVFNQPKGQPPVGHYPSPILLKEYSTLTKTINEIYNFFLITNVFEFYYRFIKNDKSNMFLTFILNIYLASNRSPWTERKCWGGMHVWLAFFC